MNIIITSHAAKQGKARLGLGKDSLKRIAAKAVEQGLAIPQTNGTTMYIHKGKSFIIMEKEDEGLVLITCLGESTGLDDRVYAKGELKKRDDVSSKKDKKQFSTTKTNVWGKIYNG